MDEAEWPRARRLGDHPRYKIVVQDPWALGWPGSLPEVHAFTGGQGRLV